MSKIDEIDMEMPLANIEFFAHEEEVWYRTDERFERLTESTVEIVDRVIEMLSVFYPKAYDALCRMYGGCALNKRYYRYRIVARFIRCNFAQLDNVPDIAGKHCHFEHVQCPLRGECAFDRVVCRPEFAHRLSAAEKPVMRLWYDGLQEDEISDRLCLSPHTVHNHIRNAYRRTGTHSRGEFVRYASEHGIFA